MDTLEKLKNNIRTPVSPAVLLVCCFIAFFQNEVPLSLYKHQIVLAYLLGIEAHLIL